MNDTEKDPRRCRELRQIERDIEISIGQARSSMDRIRGMIISLRAQRSALSAERFRLEKQWQAAAAMSLLAGPAGRAAGAQADRLAIQIAKAKADIESIDRNIEMNGPRLQLHQDRFNQWNRRLGQNASRMTALNCVFPAR